MTKEEYEEAISKLSAELRKQKARTEVFGIILRNAESVVIIIQAISKLRREKQNYE